ncbi:NAD(P)/FAD-dependent oxidoreductase [Undibacterium fentianense]|uniref:NAD(P)/FAD-dependent oxidoreductase n=1 Tax=Undibacterium fentianense TaxID=2828728 RepID=A0A941E230_9BURK|nr:NAD(P)/FAD-dependent oxidoreductase [Undibacterium fentianense]MBR7799556.1 NAD(P)/FAD-dependent oxidoreductase [Undibacterium fentianense]
MDALQTGKVQRLDVLVLGGGPAGTSAGIALLKRRDVDVMLIERSDYSEHKYGESLSSGVRSTLEYLDVWETFSQIQNLTPYYSQVAWGNEVQRQLGYMFTPHGTGWNLDRLAFEQMLANAFVKQGGKLVSDTQVITCNRQEEGGWRVEVKSKDQQMQTIFCKYIIDATGRRGVMRTNLNLALTVHDRLIGIACVADVPATRREKIVSQVEACEYGWWHISPMSDGRVSVMLMTDPDIAHKMQICNSEIWQSLLSELPIMGEQAKFLLFQDNPRSFPCFSSYLKQAGGQDWVAVGDAVASYDPISSSGIPRALASGIHGAFIAVDRLFSRGELLGAYAQAIEQDFRQYLQTQWQYYQRESRWPNAIFWARRRAVIAISKESKIKATHYFEQKLARSPVHLKANELQDLWLLCELGKPVKLVIEQFQEKHLPIPEQKCLLGLQELIETGFLELACEDEEDKVFFNTERLYFD